MRGKTIFLSPRQIGTFLQVCFCENWFHEFLFFLHFFEDFSILWFISWCPNPRAFYIVYQQPAAPIDIAHLASKFVIIHQLWMVVNFFWPCLAGLLSAVSVWIKNIFFREMTFILSPSFIHSRMSFLLCSRSPVSLSDQSQVGLRRRRKKNQVFVIEIYQSVSKGYLPVSKKRWQPKTYNGSLKHFVYDPHIDMI